MAIKEKKDNRSEVSPDYIKMYYEHQYGRLSKLEEQRLSITNIIASASLVAFTLGFANSPFTIVNGIIVPFAIIIVNIFAVDYIRQITNLITMHSQRARKILETYAPVLSQINTVVPQPKAGILGSRTSLQKLLHIIIIFIAFIPIIAYIISIT